MLLNILRLAKGVVRFKITGKFPERFINLAIKNGVGIYDTDFKDGVLYASLSVSEYKHIRHIARKSGVRLRIVKKSGLPFFINRHRYRYGLVIGAAVAVVFFIVMQNFVWSVELKGVETLSETALVSSLEEHGFYIGKFKGNINYKEIERKIMQEYKKVGWMSINVLGTKAEVEIKEKAVKPKAEYTSAPANIKSTSDGVILSADVKRGTLETNIGSAVVKGQLLVSGITETALGDVGFVNAEARIVAETKHSFEATCDEALTFFKPAKTFSRKSLEIFALEFPVGFSPQKSPYTSYISNSSVCLGDTIVPLSIYTEKSTAFFSVKTQADEKLAKKILVAKGALFRAFSLKNAESITQSMDFEKQGSTYRLKALFVCKEDIAKKENFVVNP